MKVVTDGLDHVVTADKLTSIRLVCNVLLKQRTKEPNQKLRSWKDPERINNAAQGIAFFTYITKKLF